MVTLAQLWLPILLSAVFVFVVSSLIHMVLKWHNSDYRRLPHEDAARAALREGSPAPGMYVIPHCGDMKEMDSPAMQAKYQEGPVGMLLLRPNGGHQVGKSLVQWFLLSLAIGLCAAYLASRTLTAPHYLQVFRVTGTVAFMAYGTGSVINGIWMGQPWRSVLLDLVDALLYTLVTGGTFGWLWPR